MARWLLVRVYILCEGNLEVGRYWLLFACVNVNKLVDRLTRQQVRQRDSTYPQSSSKNFISNGQKREREISEDNRSERHPLEERLLVKDFGVLVFVKRLVLLKEVVVKVLANMGVGISGRMPRYKKDGGACLKG